MARETREQVRPYAVREASLRRLLRARGWKRFRIEAIDEAFGPAANRPDLDAIVVSAERVHVARALNDVREAKGLRPLEVHVVPMVVAQDGLPIASTRIRAGVIDTRGIRKKPMLVHVGTDNPVKVRAVRRVFARLTIQSRVKGVPVPSGVEDQPFDRQAVRGAIYRAQGALRNADFGIGIEAGLISEPAVADYFDVQYCAILDRTGRVTVGHGPGFVYPAPVVARVKAGATVGQAMTDLTGVRNIGSKHGAIGYLTKRQLDRDRLTEAAILMAMVPRIRRELYAAPGPADD